MIGHAHADRRNAVHLRAPDRLFRRELRQHMADAVMAVDDRQRAGIDHEFGCRHRIHHLVAQPVEVPAQPQHAVRLVAPQVGLHQRVGNQPRILFRHALPGIDRGGKFDELEGIHGGGLSEVGA